MCTTVALFFGLQPFTQFLTILYTHTTSWRQKHGLKSIVVASSFGSSVNQGERLKTADRLCAVESCCSF